MASTIEIKATASIGYEEAARWFAQAGSDEQVKFLQEVATLADEWAVPASFQWHAIGRDLAGYLVRTDTRYMVEQINAAMVDALTHQDS